MQAFPSRAPRPRGQETSAGSVHARSSTVGLLTPHISGHQSAGKQPTLWRKEAGSSWKTPKRKDTWPGPCTKTREQRPRELLTLSAGGSSSGQPGGLDPERSSMARPRGLRAASAVPCQLWVWASWSTELGCLVRNLSFPPCKMQRGAHSRAGQTSGACPRRVVNAKRVHTLVLSGTKQVCSTLAWVWSPLVNWASLYPPPGTTQRGSQKRS